MKRNTGHYHRLALTALLLCAILFLVRNRYSLKEGLIYLVQMITWNPTDVTPIQREGSFGVLYELVAGTNDQRYNILRKNLAESGLSPLDIPSCDSCPPNLLVMFGQQGPYRLLLAHYDKSRETPTYQGASDNSAAVAVLLALAVELADHPPAEPVALLFTSGEEQGLLGARAFLNWVNESGFSMASVVGLDMIGRDLLAVRSLAPSGLHFWLPITGHMVYNGRSIGQAQSYEQLDQNVVEQLRMASGDSLAIYRAVTGYSDALPFQEQGLPTAFVTGSNIYYADLVWEQDIDRIELLDQNSLDSALEILSTFVHAPAL